MANTLRWRYLPCRSGVIGSDSISGSTSNDILWGDGYDALRIRNDYQLHYGHYLPKWSSAMQLIIGQTLDRQPTSPAPAGNDVIDAGVGNGSC